MVPEKLTWWFGMPVETWNPDEGIPDYDIKIYRLAHDWESEVPLETSLPAFLGGQGVEETWAISLGLPDETAEDLGTWVAYLVENKEKLPKLRGFFAGEIDLEESEISWIQNGAMAPVLNAFPALEDLRIRGGNGLTWEPVRHISLKKLIIETGGLDTRVLEGILHSILPDLEHLELWLGTADYGWNGTADNVRAFLYENPFPNLKYLGLKNCDHQTEIAVLAASAPVLDQLEVLDLSNGILRDEGGEALLASEKAKHLKLLDLSHHFLSPELIARFDQSGLNVNLSDGQRNFNGDYYYVAVGE